MRKHGSLHETGRLVFTNFGGISAHLREYRCAVCYSKFIMGNDGELLVESLNPMMRISATGKRALGGGTWDDCDDALARSVMES